MADEPSERTLMRQAYPILQHLVAVPETSRVVLDINRDLAILDKFERRGATNAVTASTRKRLAENTEKLVEIAKRNPKYGNIEFKCLDDYEKCKKRRGLYHKLCILSYFVCIGRRLLRV